MTRRGVGVCLLILSVVSMCGALSSVSTAQEILEAISETYSEVYRVVDEDQPMLRSVTKTQDKDKPNLPDQFHAHVKIVTRQTASVQGVGEVWADSINKRSLQTTTTDLLGEGVTSSILHPNDSLASSKLIINKMCRPSGLAKYFDFFTWMKSSKVVYEGVVEVADSACNHIHPCDHWHLSLGEKGDIHLYVDASRQTPKLLKLPLVWHGMMTSYDIHFLSLEIGADTVPPNLFDLPEYCNGVGPLCENGGLQTVRMYRVHAGDNYRVMDTNTADALGDSFYACSAYISRGFEPSKIATIFDVTLNSTWGQYALCNDYKCDGLNIVNVGREQAFGLGDYGSQCAAEMKFGVWWSLPHGGACGEGESVGTGGCTWEVPKRVKSISYKCLDEVGYFDSCKGMMIGKGSETVALLEKAFEQCDDIPPPTVALPLATII